MTRVHVRVKEEDDDRLDLLIKQLVQASRTSSVVERDEGLPVTIDSFVTPMMFS